MRADKMHPSAVLPSETCEEQAPIQSATPQTEVLCQQDTTPLQTGIDAAGLVSPPTDFSDLGGKHNLGWSPNDGGGSICSPYEQQEAPAVTAQNDVQELGHDAASEQQQGGKLVAADVQDGENGAGRSEPVFAAYRIREQYVPLCCLCLCVVCARLSKSTHKRIR